ncbi:MAG: hypothetical protein HFE73_01570 [Firmicutes bacterium]|nr:hypothetical protein [Bacillota bacterium]
MNEQTSYNRPVALKNILKFAVSTIVIYVLMFACSRTDGHTAFRLLLCKI